MKKPIKTMAWLATFGMAYFCMAIGFVFLIWQWSFLQNAEKTTGVVIDLDRQPKVNSKDQFAPIIEFETSQKEKIQLNTQVYDYPANFRRGEEVMIYYQASNPQHAKIKHFRHLWFWSSLWLAAGVLFLIVGFLSPNARGF